MRCTSILMTTSFLPVVWYPHLLRWCQHSLSLIKNPIINLTCTSLANTKGYEIIINYIPLPYNPIYQSKNKLHPERYMAAEQQQQHQLWKYVCEVPGYISKLKVINHTIATVWQNDHNKNIFFWYIYTTNFIWQAKYVLNAQLSKKHCRILFLWLLKGGCISAARKRKVEHENDFLS